jgi:CubicO group peptidase (beta-lactamase class C family)
MKNQSGRAKLAAALLLLAAAACSAAPYFPGDDFRVSTPEAQGMDSGKIAAMLRYLSANRKPVHSVLVIRNGWLVTEADFFPTPRNYRHIVNSCTKSVTSALVGIALRDRLVKDVRDPVLPYFTGRNVAAADARKKALTIRDLLMMATGMQWSEDGNYGAAYDSWRLMWESPDQVGYVLDRPMREKPGTGFQYNTGASHLLSAIVQGASGMSALDFARQRLFGPMGVRDVCWDADAAGVTVGGAGLYLQPRDLAKLGWLYLNNGTWNGGQLVPADWVAESTRKQIDTPYGLAGRYGYGYQWWMNSFGGYSARGYRGQYLFVVPKAGIVAVFTAALRNADFYLPESMMEYFILAAVKSDAPLPDDPAAGLELQAALREAVSPPPASAPQAIPEAARLVSGKRFLMRDGTSLQFVFDSPAECLRISVEGGQRIEARVGMDGVARVTDLGPGRFPDRNLVACAGRWADQDTLVMSWRNLAECEDYELAYDFGGDTVSYRLTVNPDGVVADQGSGRIEEPAPRSQ